MVVVVVLLVMEALVVAFLVELEAVESVGAAEDVTEAAKEGMMAAKVVWDRVSVAQRRRNRRWR